MSTLAFIPVRGGSKSIPLKNIKSFCGKPLVYWTVKAAHEAVGIDEVIVATDSDEIAEAVSGFGFESVRIYKRSAENSSDNSSTESVMLEYIQKLKIDKNDTFILIQATSPLLVSTDLEKGLALSSNAASVLSCVKSKRFYWTGDANPVNYDFMNRPRRQDFDGLFMENGAFYISKIKDILQTKNRISGKIAICEMPEYTGVEIDEEADWIIAESLMKRFVLQKERARLKNIKLFVTDVDGVLTDAGMYYSENGDELKKFNTHDGMAFQLLRDQNIKTAIVTSEITKLVEKRAAKLKVDHLYQGKKHGGKLSAVLEICDKENISLSEVAYIGDDINCFQLLSEVGVAACPNNALSKIKNIPGIIKLSLNGGEGVVREFAELILD
ncbi:acylneuraminate cytidylyltransferase [Mucilaginibacter xinganensis]|uniref:N-acylneuraminate cytidylyltransferase n=1 Tax=Mucilaginibacter xinganensis TaxID=1234841 RepID=A0A223NZL8_9SPHI|nr:acylneuraminate cytidylyltransferase [Mucilaginibacter xinganensis]ASU35144.1 N-acylneuraminate cytidylyltransferase [Mucilaginibacter xinganensis]